VLTVAAAAALVLGGCRSDGEPATAAAPEPSTVAVVEVRDMWVRTADSGMSAVFAVPPGCAPGGRIGEDLLG
jgi:hypothetical protein